MRLTLYKVVILSAITFFSTLEIHSQVVISGKVSDVNNATISGVQIIISEVSSQAIGQFKISNTEGKFEILIKSNSQELILKTKHLSFRDTVIRFQNKPQIFNIRLQDKVISLDEVLIKFNPPIKQSGDTIAHKVDDFRSENDSKVKDILKKLPGIEVAENGQILFNNEPINNYYIEGMDLLGDKYNLANDNISSDLIDEVQVLKNHQPIRILEELIPSQNAAINIKLKKRKVLQNIADGGVGYADNLLWNAEITNLIFSKNDQAINTYQSNNVGKYLNRQLNSLTVEELIEALNVDFMDQEWLEIRTLNNPLLNSKRWLDNKSHLATTNYLKKLKKQTFVKGNLSFLQNNLVQKGNSLTIYITPNDTITINEDQNNKLRNNDLNLELTLSNNKKNSYLRNSLESKVSWDDEIGRIHFSDSLINQRLPMLHTKIINKFKWIKPINRRLLTVNNLTGFEYLSNELSISTNAFGIEKVESSQNQLQSLNNRSIFSYNSIETNFNLGNKTLIIPTASVLIKNQTFNSSLTNTTDNDSFQNDITWLVIKSSFSMDWIFKTDYFKMQFTTPFNHYFFNRETGTDNLRFFTFEPTLRLKYEINDNFNVITSSRLEREFGSFRTYLPNSVLTNYRTLEQFNGRFQNNSVLKSKVSLQYESLFNSLFGSLSYSYSSTENNLIYADNYFNNGGVFISTSFDSNSIIKNNISSRISRRFNRIWLISLGGQYVINSFQREVNDQIIDIENRSKEIIIESIFNPTESIDINLYLKNSFNESFIFSELNQTITQLHYKADASYSVNRHQINFQGEYFDTYPNTVSNIFFIDFSWEYSFKKQASIKITLDNILNKTLYETFATDGFTVLENSFELRPFQIYLTANFTF
jgi:predicted nuclease of predicted toxin-antitoxin system